MNKLSNQPMWMTSAATLATVLCVFSACANAADPKERPYLGVQLDSESDAAKVIKPQDDGPAAKAGMKAGDVIVGFGDAEISSRADLIKNLQAAKPDQAVKVTVLRDDKKVALDVKLGKIDLVNLRAGGIKGQKAPEWKIDTWDGLADGKKSLDIADLKGKVVYLYCFQSWCPGCHSHGFPTLKKVQEEFKDADDVAFVAVQTVFEGHAANKHDRGTKIVRDKFRLDVPVGHDGAEGKRPSIMQGYKTRGTPWTIIIDKDGIVRFNAFRIEAADAVKLIKELRGSGEK